MPEGNGKAVRGGPQLGFGPGDGVGLAGPGGGGCGNPLERDRASVMEDVRVGIVSKAAAGRFYGFKEEAL